MKKHLLSLLRWLLALLVLVLMLGVPFQASAERIKDLASIQGVRSNQLSGYGLVVGLDGSGDQTTQTPFTCGLESAIKKCRRGDGDGESAGVRPAGSAA